ncbi:MAG: hypothetical protein CM15mP83_9260 [Flavobacteriaceae bacterium]|nr:MAG: hypothetical protein CM15mP83_9260 [Flavobacteriaceae bacterium]
MLTEIISRLDFLCEVGLSYLTLNRKSNSLSGGESQRINLATSLGQQFGWVDVYPRRTKHWSTPKDTKRLIRILEKLRDLGNTLIVVEHDEDIYSCSRWIVDLGPEAGLLEAKLLCKVTLNDILQSNGLTASYLTERR